MKQVPKPPLPEKLSLNITLAEKTGLLKKQLLSLVYKLGGNGCDRQAHVNGWCA